MFSNAFFTLKNKQKLFGQKKQLENIFLNFITKKLNQRRKIVSLIDTNVFLCYDYININNAVYSLAFVQTVYYLEGEMKKAVALLIIMAMSAVLFACGGSGAGGSVPTTSGTTSTSEKPVAPAAPVEPYADIDFAENSVTEKNGVISLEIKTNGEASAAAVKDVTLTFGGSTKTLSALRIENAGTWVKGVFDEFEDGAAFDVFVANAGGISIEVFYLDNSTTGRARGIVCSTESVGGDGKRSGFGIAETAGGEPYFVTGHILENEYSAVTANKASETEPVHILAVYEAVNLRNSIYVNGTLVSSDRAAGTFTSANKTEAYEGFNMGNVFYIGADPSSTPDKPEKCDFPANDLTVIDVKFYGKALSAEEAKTVYAAAAEIFR